MNTSNQQFVLSAKAFDNNLKVLSTREVLRNVDRLFLENLLEKECPSIDEVKKSVLSDDARAAYVLFSVNKEH